MPMVATAPGIPSRPSRRYGGPRGDTTHKGVDLYADRGELVRAPAAGVVQHANTTYVPGFGRYGRVVVDLAGGEMLVGHLEDVRVRPGQRVEQGDVLGTVGDTEFTQEDPTARFKESGPHAHVEQLKKGYHYPARKDAPRQNPNALAFYVPKKKGRVMPPKPPKTELFASPQDAQDRADALLDQWNALINQAVGPSARGRADMPPLLRKQLISDRARFKTFITRPTFGMGGVLWPQEWEDLQIVASDYATLQKWYVKFELRAQQVAAALPAGETLEPEAAPQELPRKTTPTENLELASKTAINIAIAVGVAAGVGLLLTLAWSKSKT